MISIGKMAREGACNVCLESTEEVAVIQLRNFRFRLCEPCGFKLAAELESVCRIIGDNREDREEEQYDWLINQKMK